MTRTRGAAHGALRHPSRPPGMKARGPATPAAARVTTPQLYRATELWDALLCTIANQPKYKMKKAKVKYGHRLVKNKIDPEPRKWKSMCQDVSLGSGRKEDFYFLLYKCLCFIKFLQWGKKKTYLKNGIICLTQFPHHFLEETEEVSFDARKAVWWEGCAVHDQQPPPPPIRRQDTSLSRRAVKGGPRTRKVCCNNYALKTCRERPFTGK